MRPRITAGLVWVDVKIGRRPYYDQHFYFHGHLWPAHGAVLILWVRGRYVVRFGRNWGFR